MSREVRRVPLGWKHPVEPNPNWEFQQRFDRRMSAVTGEPRRPASRLHGPTERFVALLDDYPAALATWQDEGRQLSERTGRHWDFNLRWHLDGIDDCTCHPGQSGATHPFYVWSADGEREIEVALRDADHLHELLEARHAESEPDPDDYMPIFDTPADELGWCLYQTVSEGTPVTPVFASADELVDHLATVGQDGNQQPMRHEAAEALVRTGWTVGSFAVIDGQLLRSDEHADVLTGNTDSGK